jgi:2-keto-4-pentenoate hydratase/2-oxohepta-3-ene-1,7-dioic acid hydratase in catechol pathway
MLLYRLGPEGFYAATDGDGVLRYLHSDPFSVGPGGWDLGRPVPEGTRAPMVPVKPSKVVGIGRNYRAHAAELDNPMPEEPLIFLKAPSSLLGPSAAVVLPPESQRVEYEGEIAVVLGERAHRLSREDAARAILGVTCACDVTARDLQRKDATFARGKSFDTFCPLGPAIAVDGGRGDLDLEDLEVITRLNGEERQRGHVTSMEWGLAELVSYVSRHMTLEPGDVLLTGTPAGVGPLAAGDRLEVEIPGVGVLGNPVEAWARA